MVFSDNIKHEVFVQFLQYSWPNLATKRKAEAMWILAPKNLLRICEICSGGRDWWGTMDMTVGWLVSLSKKWRRGALIVVSSVERYFLNKSLRDDAASVVQQYFWLSLLNYCSGQRQKSVAGVLFIVSDLPPSCLGWPGLPPQIALSRPDICQIHSRRIICLKLSIPTCLVPQPLWSAKFFGFLSLLVPRGLCF